MILKILLIVLQFNLLLVSCIKITKLSVPLTYVIDLNYCRPLILDCDYEFRVDDVGFVLKWYHNSHNGFHLIYQWIPPRKPYIFSALKYHIDTSFITNNENSKFKYRGIQLMPHYNLTGEWMCSVQTYSTHDRKIARMQVIVPERSFELYHHDLNFYMESSQVFIVICTVKDIYPEPELSIIINKNFSVISEERSENDENGFFNKSIMSRIDKNIHSPSTIECTLSINGTDYIKKKRFIYYDYKRDKNYPNTRDAIPSKYSTSSASSQLQLIFRQLIYGQVYCLLYSYCHYLLGHGR
ncbi:hypothetical protein PVAND_013292 [Polypedilum vanderplanki]|uniref:Ig-like domain-containing protein n=1 Tax=Polypedilum vanderplanki TaxID=319348 RepID=A0A9J6CQ88_POLVA|nr:hypothetical protein PVAND_013292 [Polypedilum vanderplanki]